MSDSFDITNHLCLQYFFTSSGQLQDIVDVNGLNEIVVALEPRVALVTNPSDVVTAVR